MTRMQNGFQALYPKKPEPANQSQYRNVNANSTGGMHPAYMAQSYKDFAAKSDPVLNRRSNNAAPRDPYNPLTARQPTAPFMVRPHGSTAGAIADLNKGFNRLRGSDPWADKVNRMDNEQLDQAVAPGVNAFRSRQSPASVASNSAWSSVPNGIAVSQGSPFPVTPRGRVTSDGLNKLFHSPVPAIDMLGQVQALSQTPRQNSGFSMDGPRQVSASVPPIGTSTPPLRRSDVPAWSLNGGVSPETARASQSFNQAAQAPVNTGKIISDRIAENMNNASIQGRQDANDIVDRNLNARMGFYSTPQARRGGFFQRGMGPMAGDAAIMQSQNRPLGDGGPAAYAARSDQENRRRSAEAAMGGASPDGLTRYTPNQDVLDFANKDRVAEDERISKILGSGTQYRQPMQAMTPAEIQFNRHKMSMATNPQYRARVDQQRADRQEMLDNRREMVRARRAGALEAAGASQQLRNLQAGRGAIAGQDGFNALMSAAAQQNPNAAFGDFGQAAMAQNAPGMLRDRLQAEKDMLGTRANIDRMQQYENMRMQIITSGMPQMEQQRALQALNNSILMGGGFGAVQAPGAQGGGGYVPPSGVPLPDRSGADPNEPTAAAYARYMIGLKASPQWNSMTREQQDEFLANIRSQYFPGMTESDFAQYREDNETDILSIIGNAIMGAFGHNPAAIQRKEERRNALEPPTKPPADSPWSQGGPTDNDRRVLGAMGFR